MDTESRFSELLNPIRDLNKNWEIEISFILQEYLHELERITLTIHNGETSLNFAEAALVIQGSTCVYGKKVEYLYNLVFQLFQRLNNEKKTLSPNGKEKDVMLSRSSDEFVPLDDIKKCKNLRMVEDNTHRKYHRSMFTPLALVPLEDNEKGDVMLISAKGEIVGNKRDFQLNVCNIHDSGVLLLPTTDFIFLPKDSTRVAHSLSCNACSGIPAEDSAPYESPPHSPSAPNSPDPDPEPPANLEDSPELVIETEECNNSAKNSVLQRRRSMRQAMKAQQAAEEKEKSEENGSIWKSEQGDLPEFKKQIQRKNVKKLPRKLLKRSAKKISDDGFLNAPMNFCSQAFFSHETKFAKKMKNGNNIKVFEKLFFDELLKQKALLQHCRKKLNLNENTEVKEDPDDCEKDDDDDDLGAGVLPDDDDDDDMPNEEDPFTPVLNTDLENGLSASEQIPVVSTYEELVRKHVEIYMKDVAQYCQTTELSEKVNKWEERIKPILENESQRENYNIHVYGDRIIGNFADTNRKQTLTFTDICKGKEGWEICRYFLASLQLANTGNIEIGSTRNTKGSDKIDLTLLSRKRHHEDLAAFGHNAGEH